jgi:integrase
MQLRIDDLVAGVMSAIKSKGYPQNTLDIYRYSYNSIARWFHNENDGFYSLEVASKYLDKRYELVRQKKIASSFYQHSKRYLNFIQEYAETGVASLSYEHGKRLYQPSHEAAAIVESMLAVSRLPEKSKSKYRTLANKFFCFIESEGLATSEVTFNVMLSFVNHVHGSNSNRYHTLRMLRILSDYLESVGIMSSSPDFECFRLKSNRKRLIPAFSMNEVSSILASFDKTTPLGKRNYAIVLLSCGTGLRASDIANLKLRDIDWKSGEVNIIQEKTLKPLKTILNGQIRNAISDYILGGRPKSDSTVVFLSARAPHKPFNTAGFSGIIDRACVAVGIPKKPRRSFHSLRRSFGTWMAKEEVAALTISQMLGQSGMDSSVPYLSFDDKQILLCAMGLEDVPLKGGVYA